VAVQKALAASIYIHTRLPGDCRSAAMDDQCSDAARISTLGPEGSLTPIWQPDGKFAATSSVNSRWGRAVTPNCQLEGKLAASPFRFAGPVDPRRAEIRIAAEALPIRRGQRVADAASIRGRAIRPSRSGQGDKTPATTRGIAIRAFFENTNLPARTLTSILRRLASRFSVDVACFAGAEFRLQQPAPHRWPSRPLWKAPTFRGIIGLLADTFARSAQEPQ